MKSATESVIVRGIPYSVHRFNANIMMVSLVIVEEIQHPERYSAARIVTYLSDPLHPDGRNAQIVTSVDIQKYRDGQWTGDGREPQIRSMYNPGDFSNATEQHKRATDFQSSRIKNPNYRVVS